MSLNQGMKNFLYSEVYSGQVFRQESGHHWYKINIVRVTSCFVNLKVFPFKRVIKRTKILAEIKRMKSRNKGQTGKTDTHNNYHKITKIKRTKKQK